MWFPRQLAVDAKKSCRPRLQSLLHVSHAPFSGPVASKSPSQMANFKFTLLLYVSLVVAVATPSNANSFGPHRRDHADLGRLLKKRTPAGVLDVLGSQPSASGQQTPSTSPAAQPTQASSGVAQTTPANSASVQTTSVVASASTSTVSSILKAYDI